MKRLAMRILLGVILVVLVVPFESGYRACAAEQTTSSSIVVKMKQGTSAADQAAVIARNGGVSTSSIPALRMHVIAIPSDAGYFQIVQNYQSDPQVERVEQNKERQAEALPNDTLYGVQWAMPKIGWESSFRRFTPLATARIAVLDTGVDAAHPDLGADVVLSGKSFLDASDGRTDFNGHGTWLAGIVGAVADNGQGIAGICTAGVKVLPVKVLNTDGIGRDGDIIAGIAWAIENGANVILMGFSNTDFSQSLQDAIDYAWENGAILVAAAGNAGVDTPAFPAGNRGVIGVSATNQDDVLAAGSNYGQSVFLAAPGDTIYTTSPGEGYTYITGTSASSAIVAGVAAYMKAVDPTLTNGMIVGRLATSADGIGIPGDPANRMMYGNGRINMGSALTSTATESIQPAGAAPVGTGGPYVGPYAKATQFQVSASFSANTSTITASGSGVNSSWIYQYAYEPPSGPPVYHPCTPGSSFSSDTMVLTSGYQTGAWKVYLYAYNPSYNTCLNNGSATKSDMTTTNVSVTTAYMSVSPANGTYGGTTTLSASLTIGTPLSGKTVLFTLNNVPVGSATTNSSGVATLSNVSLGTLNAGSYPTGIGASFAGDGIYLPSSAAGSLTVAQATPTVTAWPVASAIDYNQPLTASILSGGSATTAGTFSFAAPATMPSAGTYDAAVLFTPVDGTNFKTVTGSVNVIVNKLTPTVSTWPTATGIIYGEALSASTLNGGGATVPGTFAFTSPTTFPASGTYTAAAVFTPGDSNFNTVTGSVPVAVSKATPTVTTWPTATGITYPQPLSGSTLTGGSASVMGTFSFVVPATVPNAGKYSAAVIFRPTDVNINELTGNVEVDVTKGTPSVTAWPSASSISYTQPLSSSTLSGGTASVPGTFSFANPAIMPASGEYAASVTFTPADASYITVSGVVEVTVDKASPSVTAWPTASGLTYGQALSSSVLSAGEASVPGVFSFVTPATILTAGSHTVTVVFTPADSNYNTVSGSASVAVDKATPTVTAWPTANTITFGQQLAAASLSGGTASVAGTFAYATPAAVLDAGSHTVAVIFTAVDPSYNIVSGSAQITVNRATSSVTVWPSPTAITYGQQLSASTLSGGSASVDGTFSFAAPATVPNAGIYSAAILFTPTSNNYTTVSGSIDLTVNKVTPTVTTWPTAGGIIYGQPVSTSVLSGGSASIPGTFSFVAPSVVPSAGTYTAALLFTPGDGNYNTVSGNVDISVAKAAPTITAWPEATPLVYGQSLSLSTLSGGFSSVPGSFSFAAPGIVPDSGTYSAVVTFTPADSANFQSASGSASVMVSPAPQTIIFANVPDTAYSLAPIALLATATSGMPISFTTLTATVCTVSGDRVTMTGVGTCTIEASQQGSLNYYPAAVVGRSFVVNSGDLDHFAVSAVTGPQTAGIPFAITITAQDAWNHTVTGFTGPITLSTTAGTITPAVTSPFVEGVWTGDAMVTGAGSGKTISVAAGPKTGTGSSFDVNPGNAVAFTVTAPAISSAGQAFDISVTARDSFNNQASGYAGTVHFTSTDGRSGVFLPADYSFGAEDGGTRTFAGVLLETAGNQTITASDMADSSIAGTSGSIAVNPSGVAKLAIVAPATATAGTAFPVTVSVRDAFDNTVDGYTGTISFTGSDPYGTVPSVYTFVPGDGGRHAFVATTTFKTSGIHTLSAADVSTPGISGTSGSISVNSAAASTLNFSQQPGTSMPNEPFAPAVAVSVKDQYGNLVTGSTLEVSLALAAAGHSGTLNGTTMRATTNGIATFPDISLAAEGNNYLLTATSGSLPSVTSVYFDVITGTCGNIGWLTVPAFNTTGIVPLTWAATNVTKATYIVEQSKDGGGFSQVYSGSDTSAVITVTAIGSYVYRVKAIRDGYISSEYTAGSNACTVQLTCPVPLSLTVPSANSTGAIQLSWNPGNFGGATYVVEQSKNGGPFSQIFSGPGTSAVVNVTENGTYTYRIKATKSGYYDSGYTVGSTGCVVHLACGAPPTVTVPTTNSNGVIPVSWSPSDVSGATYILEQSQDGGPYTPVYSGTNTFASVSVIVNGIYTYRVKATKVNYDPSGYTNGPVGCTVHLACGAPGSLTVPATNSTGIVRFNWGSSDVSGATYILEQSQDGGAFTIVYSGTNTFASIAVNSNGTYTYRVKATKTNYDPSPYTAGSDNCVVHLACGPPSSIDVPTTNSTGTYWIRWGVSDVEGVTYVLEQSQDGGAYTVVYTGNNTFANIVVTVNGNYSYRVKATKQNYDTSPYRSGNNSCAVHLVCGAPAQITIPGTNSTGIIGITWGSSDVAGVTYVLEQSQDGGSFTQIYSGTSPFANITVSANGNYTYRLKATKTNYDPSPYISGTTGCAVHLACGAPGSMSVPASNSTGVIGIAWTASDVTGVTYILEQSLDGGPFLQVYSGPALTANVAVSANGAYSYRVKATRTTYDPSVFTTSGASCAVHLACGAPTFLTVPGSNSTGVIGISWGASDVSGATYILEQSKDGGAFSPVYSGTNTFTNISADANGTYTYRVKATRANYDPSPTTSSSAGCQVRLACGAPSSLNVPAANSTGNVRITWGGSDVSGVTYVLEQSQEGSPFTEVYSGTDLFANIPVSVNGTYTYRIKATKTNFESSTFTPGSPCTVRLACGAPSSLSVPGTNSTGAFWVTWGPSDVSGATYVLEQSLDGGAFAEVYSGTNTFANVVVTASGKYTYRVKAQKANYDTSTYTPGTTLCTVSLACGAPGSLTVPSQNSTGTFWVSWASSNVGGVTYILEQSQDGGAYTQVYSGPYQGTNVTVPATGNYSFRVRAQKDGYTSSVWTVGGNACSVMLYSNVRLSVAGQSDIFFSSLRSAISGLAAGASATLTSWVTTFMEDINLDKADSALTIGSAFDTLYRTVAGPTVVQGIVTITAGTLIAENMVVR